MQTQCGIKPAGSLSGPGPSPGEEDVRVSGARMQCESWEGREVAVPARISGGAGAWDDQAARGMKSRVQGERGQVCGGHSYSVCREVSCLKPGPQERGNEPGARGGAAVSNAHTLRERQTERSPRGRTQASAT